MIMRPKTGARRRVLRRADRLALAHGACVVVELDDVAAALAALAPAEQQRAAELGPIRSREFIAGRTALHLALGSDAAILSDDRGAPILPAGVGRLGVAQARARRRAGGAGGGQPARRRSRASAAAPRGDIGRRILTAREQAR